MGATRDDVGFSAFASKQRSDDSMSCVNAAVPAGPATAASAEASPTIRALPELRVLSLRAVLPNYPAQGELWRQLFTFAKAHDVAIAGPSFAINHTKDCKQSEVDVEVCLPIATNTQVPEEPPLLVRDLPAVPRAATAIHIGSYDGLCNVYPKLFAWVATEGLSPAGPSREVYVQRNSGGDDQPNLTEIQLPIA